MTFLKARNNPSEQRLWWSLLVSSACLKKNVTSKLKEMWPYLECCVQCWSPSVRVLGILERVQQQAMKMMKGLVLLFSEKLRELCTLQPGEEEA